MIAYISTSLDMVIPFLFALVSHLKGCFIFVKYYWALHFHRLRLNSFYSRDMDCYLWAHVSSVLCVIVDQCIISWYIRLCNNKVQLCFPSDCNNVSNILCNGGFYMWYVSPSNGHQGSMPYCYAWQLCMVCTGPLICLLIQWWTSIVQKYICIHSLLYQMLFLMTSSAYSFLWFARCEWALIPWNIDAHSYLLVISNRMTTSSRLSTFIFKHCNAATWA